MASARNAPVSSTEILGTRLLSEIESEEGSLEDVRLSLSSISNFLFPAHHTQITCFRHQLTSPPFITQLLTDLRTSTNPNPPRTGLPDLDTLWHSHGSRQLSISGRSLPLIYHLITHLVCPGHNPNGRSDGGGTVAVLDIEGRFSPSHLLPSLSKDQLKHIYIWHPTPANLAVTLESVEQFMVYGDHASRDRVWKAIFVLGGSVAGKGVRCGDVVTVTTGWRGWLRVEREAVEGFLAGTSVEEAWGDRAARERALEGRGWRGVSEVGEFVFK
ncbi:hypothetical protein LOCC1_G004717 [Lachnellula occidentalis]|uniref:Uncharacterized protein n=1 Tax=Lachnellula occidentalis TaxID=215460 RepID=A0A8H8RQ69_9HELO|nr:hypothetical protein LOCC1_G004717 [Lachnellula occidentalis]